MKTITPGILTALASCKGISNAELVNQSAKMPQIVNGKSTWAGTIVKKYGKVGVVAIN